jgi:hypothetical protein
LCGNDRWTALAVSSTSRISTSATLTFALARLDAALPRLEGAVELGGLTCDDGHVFSAYLVILASWP